jgi:hypothetical protein
MTDFITMVNRIAVELRRSNMMTEIKNAINDAIAEEGKARLYLNEMRGITFDTVAGQEYYPDMGVVEMDDMYYYLGSGSRYTLEPRSQLVANRQAEGSAASGGQPTDYARYGEELRIYPIPSVVTTIYMDGFGKLTPWPLVADNDTNAWMTTGERLIRASAKAVILKDVIRDFGEAGTYDAIAADFRESLAHETTLRSTSSTFKSTQW